MVRRKAEEITIMNGNLIIAESGGHHLLGLASETTAGRYKTLLEDGREIQLRKDRIIWMSGSVFNMNGEELQSLSAAHREAAAGMNLEELWELIVDEEPEMPLKAFTDLALSDISEPAKAAMILTVSGDQPYFKFQSEAIKANSRQTVTERLRQMMKVEKERKLLQEITSLLKDCLAKGEVDLHALSVEARNHIDHLQQLAISGKEYIHYRKAEVLLQRIWPESRDAFQHLAFKTMVSLGLWHEDEDLNIVKHKLVREFPEIVLNEIEARVQAGLENMETLKDLTGLHAVSIDDAFTTEVDDAFAIERDKGGFKLHVFISDAAAFVPRGSAIDNEARSRASTLYHPTGKYLMLPEKISEHAASLAAGERRPALCFIMEIDSDGIPQSLEIEEVVARIGTRLTYDEADRLLKTPEVPPETEADKQVLDQASKIAEQLRAHRFDKGAIFIEQDEIQVRLSPAGGIELEKVSRNSPSRRLVAELMILCGSLTGKYCAEHGVPAVYRHQAAPDIELKREERMATEPHQAMAALMAMKRPELSTHPKSHHSLGVNYYTQVTSPLRRYQDLIMHHQLRGFLSAGKAPLTDEGIMRIFGNVEEAGSLYATIERGGQRYWILKYLERHRPETMEGTVSRIFDRGYEIFLKDYCIKTKVNTKGKYRAGDVLKLRIAQVNARKDRLVLTD